MPAYFVAMVDVTDAAAYEQYKALAQKAIAQYGGKYIARGGEVEYLEGAIRPPRVVILQFDSMADARRWYHSPEYAQAKQTRANAAVFSGLLVEGLPAPL